MNPSSDAVPPRSDTLDAMDTLDTLRRENAQLQAQLKQATAELESFTYSVSHDLRASLRHISAFVKILDEDLGTQVDAGVASHLKIISGAASHMTLMIDGLMELSRLGRAELKPTRVEMRPLIDEVRALLERELAGHTTPIKWQIADDFPALQGDAVMIRQVLRNLLSNAIKFTRPAEPVNAAHDTTIFVGWHLDDAGQCEIQIRDNGVGFDPKYQGKLFQVFTRLHSAEAFPGIGMGLALTRRMVERHGGEISATAEKSGGCDVRLTLPLAQALSQI